MKVLLIPFASFCERESTRERSCCSTASASSLHTFSFASLCALLKKDEASGVKIQYKRRERAERRKRVKKKKKILCGERERVAEREEGKEGKEESLCASSSSSSDEARGSSFSSWSLSSEGRGQGGESRREVKER